MNNPSYIQDELPIGHVQDSLPIEDLEDFAGYDARIGGKSLLGGVTTGQEGVQEAEGELVKVSGWDIVDPIEGTAEIWEYIGDNGYTVSFELVRDKDGNIHPEYSDGNIESLRQSVKAYQAMHDKVVRESAYL